MKPVAGMLDNPYFHQWVANTLDGLGAFGAAYLQGLQREWALTSFESGIPACQEAASHSDEWFSVDFMRFVAIVPTNLDTIH